MVRLDRLRILAQPDDTTCGPTCLHAMYNYYRDPLDMARVIREVPTLDGGGTLAVHLACHALERGYRARIYTYNLQLFDPTWFQGRIDLADRLRRQMEAKTDDKLRVASEAYLKYLKLGGEVLFQDLTTRLLRNYLNQGAPILTGLSSTYLYHAMRETGDDCREDDVRGEPGGHFVILCGYDRKTKNVLIADPFKANPLSDKQLYPVPLSRVIGAILLGIVTYDANLLILQPKPKPRPRRRRSRVHTHRR